MENKHYVKLRSIIDAVDKQNYDELSIDEYNEDLHVRFTVKKVSEQVEDALRAGSKDD